MDALRPDTPEGLEALLHRPRAIVFVSVEWAAQERSSRLVFAGLVDWFDRERPDLGITFAIAHEDCPGLTDWFRKVNPPNIAATGYGAVLWLDAGRLLDAVEYAAREGLEALIDRTLARWPEAGGSG